MNIRLLLFCILFSTTQAFGQGYNGLVGLWKFDGNANDASGNGLHGIPYNMTPATGINGSPGTAYKFNGTSSYIDVPYNALMNTEPHSFCVVIKPTGFYDGNAQGNAIIWRGPQFTNDFSYHLEMFDNAYDNSDGIFSPTQEVFAGWTGVQTSNTPQQEWYYNPTIDSNVWYSVVLTYDGDTTKIYVDGVMVNTFYNPCNFYNTTNSLFFGKSQENQNFPFWLNAVVDEIRFYDHPLTPTEVIQFGDSFGTGRILPVKLFLDANGNCIKETTEKLNTEALSIKVDSNGIPVDTISATGFFYYHADGDIGDVYSFSVLQPLGSLYVTCPTNNILHDTIVTGINATKYIGLSCNPGSDIDLEVYASSSVGITSQELCVQIGNQYCTPVNSTLTVNFSPSFVFGSAIPTPTSVTGTTATWDFAMLSYLNSPANINITLNVPGNPLIAGDTVNTICSITPNTGDINLTNNIVIQTDTVKASLDPNDISVTPKFCIPSFISTKLRYTVRFENIGNAPASNIYVMDTLSGQLDAASLTLIAASHNVTLSHWYDDIHHHIYKFEFLNINLPDSSHHDECHGMFIFDINTKSGLPDNTIIPNHAGIFFDENAVVLTNTVHNLTGCDLDVPTMDTKEGIKIYPNPTSNEITIESDVAIRSISIYNVLGQPVRQSGHNSKSINLDIADLPTGIYHIKINKTLSRTFIKE